MKPEWVAFICGMVVGGMAGLSMMSLLWIHSSNWLHESLNVATDRRSTRRGTDEILDRS